MKRIQKIERQIELCRLLSETLYEEAERAIPEDREWYDKYPNSSLPGYTRLGNDIIKLRRELRKLENMLMGKYEEN